MMENGSTNGSDFLRVEGVVKNFGAVSVLKGVDLHVREGEVLGLIGDNGAGKSTLLKTITGFHRPDEGRILRRRRGQPPLRLPGALSGHPDRLPGPRARQRALGLPQHVPERRDDRRTLPEQPQDEEKTSQYLADMGVNIPSIDTEVARLSGGQRQAIAVARAVYSDAKMLLLDEPLAAMGAKEEP